MHDWEATFKSLKIPAEYARLQSLYDDQETLKSLAAWQSNIHIPLGALRNLVGQKRATGEPIDDATLANIVFYVSPFAIESENDGLDLSPWSTPSAQHTALGTFPTTFCL